MNIKLVEKKIGYTTGVFDLFHIGHLNILKKAKENCDYLIVGVSTDELVEDYKKKIPVIPYEQRAEIVAAIRYVDEVVPQTSMNKIKAWEKLRFHKMFHGDDWKGSEMWNKIESEFRKINVEIVYFPYTKNVSTTSVKNTLSVPKSIVNVISEKQ